MQRVQESGLPPLDHESAGMLPIIYHPHPQGFRIHLTNIVILRPRTNLKGCQNAIAKCNLGDDTQVYPAGRLRPTENNVISLRSRAFDASHTKMNNTFSNMQEIAHLLTLFKTHGCQNWNHALSPTGAAGAVADTTTMQRINCFQMQACWGSTWWSMMGDCIYFTV